MWQRFWEVLGDAAGSSWVWLVPLIRYWLLVAAMVAPMVAAMVAAMVGVGHPFEGRGQAAAPSLALLQVSDKMVHDWSLQCHACPPTAASATSAR